jgi:hypothetical protein
MPWETGTSPAALYGTEIHSMVEAALAGVPVPKFTSKHAVDFAAWERWWDPTISVEALEQPYCIDIDGNVSKLEKRGKRNYDDAPALSIVGTADCVTDTSVIDWKTGAVIGEARESEQLRFLGALADKSEINLVQIRSGGIEARGASLAADERAEIKRDAVNLLKIYRDDPRHTGGKWCRWCPARSACPKNAFAKLAKTGEKTEFSF